MNYSYLKEQNNGLFQTRWYRRGELLTTIQTTVPLVHNFRFISRFYLLTTQMRSRPVGKLAVHCK